MTILDRGLKGLERIDSIRRQILGAIFSDDELFDRLALKGGNALRLVYGIQGRASLDLDLSLDGDIDDFEKTGARLTRIVENRLDSAGLRVFDATFTRRPADATGRWGGYVLEFKLAEKRIVEELGGNLDGLRRQSVATGPEQGRKWRVEISKFEVCTEKVPSEVESFAIFVYSLEMIVIEKLRAICQQMGEYYTARRHPAPRPRDFFDIRQIVGDHVSVDNLKAKRDLAVSIFAAKEVPLELLLRIRETREFHAADWSSVIVAVGGECGEFDVYFDFVVDLAEQLEAVWNV